MQKDVFISYQHTDAVFAHALCDELERQGVSCWIAPRNILPGTSWRASIVSAVESTHVMALIFSSNTQKSKQVIKELSIADEYDAIMVPILLEDIEPQGDFKFQLTGTHWIRAFGGGDTALKHTVWQIRQYLDSRPAEKVTPARPDRPRQPVGPSTQVSTASPQALLRPSPATKDSLLSPKNIALAVGFLALMALAAIGFKAAFVNDKDRGSPSAAVNVPAPVPVQIPTLTSTGQAPAPTPQQVPMQPQPTQQGSAPEIVPVSPPTPKTTTTSPSPQASLPSNSASIIPASLPPGTEGLGLQKDVQTQTTKEHNGGEKTKSETVRPINNLFRPPK